jgi:hypothetical protein
MLGFYAIGGIEQYDRLIEQYQAQEARLKIARRFSAG